MFEKNGRKNVAAWKEAVISGNPNAKVDVRILEQITEQLITNDCRVIEESLGIIASTSNPDTRASRERLVQDALEGSEYVDISTFLPELVRIYGIPPANRILREFGAERLIFATDYPQVYKVEPQDIYETYCDILNQMDFTDEEIERIAFRNISEILGLPEL